MKAKRLLAIFALLAAISVACSGCWAIWIGGAAVAGAGIAIGVTAYVEGNLEVSVESPPPEAENAAEKAFDALGIAIVSKNSSATSAELVGKNLKGDKVKVGAEAAGANGSKLSIRIGVFGDEAESVRIYDEMKKHLAVPANPKGK